MWVCHGSKVKGNAIVIAELEEDVAGELSAIIGDDAVGDTESKYDLLDEIGGLLCSDRGNRLGLNPLGELVHGDEDVCEAPRCRLERTNHV